MILGVHSSEVTPWTQINDSFYLTKIIIPWATALKESLPGISLENAMKKLNASSLPHPQFKKPLFNQFWF